MRIEIQTFRTVHDPFLIRFRPAKTNTARTDQKVLIIFVGHPPVDNSTVGELTTRIMKDDDFFFISRSIEVKHITLEPD